MKEPQIKAQYKSVAIFYCGECRGNAEQSVIKAGYSEKYARGNAHKIVARSDVQEYIKYLNSISESNPLKHIATVAEIQSFWTDILNDDKQQTKDRLKASELLAKCKGMFNQNEW